MSVMQPGCAIGGVDLRRGRTPPSSRSRHSRSLWPSMSGASRRIFAPVRWWLFGPWRPMVVDQPPGDIVTSVALGRRMWERIRTRGPEGHARAGRGRAGRPPEPGAAAGRRAGHDRRGRIQDPRREHPAGQHRPPARRSRLPHPVQLPAGPAPGRAEAQGLRRRRVGPASRRRGPGDEPSVPHSPDRTAPAADDVRGKANPKSSTGRLDVFTRRHHRRRLPVRRDRATATGARCTWKSCRCRSRSG